MIYTCFLGIYTSPPWPRTLLPFTHTHQPFIDFKGSLLHKGGDPQGWNRHTLPLISEHFSELGRQEVLLWPFKNKGIGHKG